MGAFTPSGSTGSQAGTTQNDARTGKSPTGFVNLRIRVRRRAIAPESLVAFPSSIFFAPTMSMRSWATGDCMAGVNTRSSECTRRVPEQARRSRSALPS